MEEKLREFFRRYNGLIMMGAGIGLLLSLGGGSTGNT